MLQQLQLLLDNEIDPAFAKRAEFIFTTVEEKKPAKVLDAGCGRGFYVNALSNYDFLQEIHGIDLNKTYLEKAKKYSNDIRIHLKKESIYTTGFPDNYFDLIICSEVLEHLDDDARGLQELRRILKKNGTLIVTVPHKNFPFLWDPLNWLLMKVFGTHVSKDIWWLAGMWADHIRLYSEEQLKKLTSQQGFATIKTEKIVHGCWPFSHFLLYGIGKNIVERLGIDDFNRFHNEKKPLSQFLASIMAFPSHNEVVDNKSFVDLAYSLKKI